MSCILVFPHTAQVWSASAWSIVTQRTHARVGMALTEMGVADHMATICQPERDRGEGAGFLDELEVAYTAIDKLPEVEVSRRA